MLLFIKLLSLLLNWPWRFVPLTPFYWEKWAW